MKGARGGELGWKCSNAGCGLDMVTRGDLMSLVELTKAS